jgi:hypothetical protein
VLLLVLFAWMADSSTRDKCAAFDEVAHLTGGYSYWETRDYRLNPENGMLPQRWTALPAYFRGLTFPDLDQPEWNKAFVWKIAYDFFFTRGNDPDRMLRTGRRMILVFGMALGLLVYAWSRQFFGPAGGMISLLLYVLSPNLLAHSRLATSDVALALFLTLAVACFWQVLHRLTVPSLIGFTVVMGLLFLSKGSSFSIVPMMLLLIGIRLLDPDPLAVRIGKEARMERAAGKLLCIGGVLIVSALVTLVMIWTFHGFHYASGAASTMQFPWDRVLSRSGWGGGLIELARTWQLLPESYLYGAAHALSGSQARLAFLHGEIRTTGWWYFFPYAFLVKTPLATLAMLSLAATGLLRSWFLLPRSERRERAARWLYGGAPLLVLLGVYWAFSIPSKLNIGHRHILPTYPALMILAGAAGFWLRRPGWKGKTIVCLLLAGLLIESWTIRPHYLAFFNRIAGGPAQGYRHLVDSSLDWGQDLPGLKRWLDREQQEGYRGNVYLSYFGMSSPGHYGISALPLPGFMESAFHPAFERFPLTEGIYAISATMLHNYYVSSFSRGPWTKEHQAAFDEVNRRLAMGVSSNALLSNYEWLRFARLTSYLREREPDEQIGHSILIYRLTREDAHRALFGPLQELSEDPRGSV